MKLLFFIYKNGTNSAYLLLIDNSLASYPRRRNRITSIGRNYLNYEKHRLKCYFHILNVRYKVRVLWLSALCSRKRYVR